MNYFHIPHVSIKIVQLRIYETKQQQQKNKKNEKPVFHESCALLDIIITV